MIIYYPKKKVWVDADLRCTDEVLLFIQIQDFGLTLDSILPYNTRLKIHPLEM